jgi:hypothetical protein
MENMQRFPIIDFSDWEGLDLLITGAREKKWLRNNKTGEIGLFKYPKTTYTGDYWAEKLAYELGKLINIEIARTELGIYKGRRGSFSYNVLKVGEHLLEGYAIIGDVLEFNTSSEIYDNIGFNYSVELLENVLADYSPLLLKVFVFDCFIGNTDRHHGNWAIITDDNGVWLRLSPLYDNGSSLCYLERVERIELMKKDPRMLNAALYTKPKSQIGLGDVRPADHFDLFSYVCSKYHKNIKKMMNDLKNRITKKSISDLLNKLDNNIIDEKIKQFLNIFIFKRKDKMVRGKAFTFGEKCGKIAI